MFYSTNNDMDDMDGEEQQRQQLMTIKKLIDQLDASEAAEHGSEHGLENAEYDHDDTGHKDGLELNPEEAKLEKVGKDEDEESPASEDNSMSMNNDESEEDKEDRADGGDYGESDSDGAQGDIEDEEPEHLSDEEIQQMLGDKNEAPKKRGVMSISIMGSKKMPSRGRGRGK